MDKFEDDVKVTIEYRNKLLKNVNLMHWYSKSYEEMFKGYGNSSGVDILEIGSGTSPIKFYHQTVITSDILPLEFVEYHFDAMEIDDFEPLKGKQFDIITFTNVLHHIKQPLKMLEKFEKKLKPNGRVIFLEPYFSLLSTFIYKYIHYEYTNQHITKPELENIEGPLTSSNIALPYLIFFKRKPWLDEVEKSYVVENPEFYTALSYFMSGGISYRIPIPRFIYKILFAIDAVLAKLFPKLFASFFIAKLKTKRQA